MLTIKRLCILYSSLFLLSTTLWGQGYTRAHNVFPYFFNAYCYNDIGNLVPYQIIFTITEIEEQVSPDQSSTVTVERQPETTGGDGSTIVDRENSDKNRYDVATGNSRFILRKDPRFSYKIQVTAQPVLGIYEPDYDFCDLPRQVRMSILSTRNPYQVGMENQLSTISEYDSTIPVFDLSDEKVMAEFVITDDMLAINDYPLLNPAPAHPWYPDGGLFENLGSIIEFEFQNLGGTLPFFTLSLPTAIVGAEPIALSDAIITSPELPFMILHDPPGDESFSFYEAASTNCTGFQLSAATDESDTQFNTLKMGTSGVASFFGPIGIPFSVYAQQTNEETIGIRETTNDGYEACVTTVNRYQTAAESNNWTWQEGDQFIMSAQDFKFGQVVEAWAVNFHNYVRFAKKTSLVAVGTPTLYNRSEYEIRHVQMPNQLAIINNVSSTSVDRARAQVAYDSWQKLLDMNNRIKQTRVEPFPLNVGSGSPQTYSTQHTITKTESFNAEMYVDGSAGFETGINFSGVGGTNGSTFTTKISYGDASLSSTYETKTTGYELQDNDIDQFNITRYTDEVFGTPFFVMDEQQSVTSCPYEGGLRKDNPVLEFSLQNTGPWTSDLEIASSFLDDEPARLWARACNDVLAASVVEMNARPFNLQRLNLEPISIKIGTIDLGNSNEGQAIAGGVGPGESNCRVFQLELTLPDNPETLTFNDLQLQMTTPPDCGNIAETSTANLSISFTAPNDNLCKAVSVANGGLAKYEIPTDGLVQHGFHNFNATVIDGEGDDDIFFSPDFNFSDNLEHSVWFNFIAPPSGAVDISTCYDYSVDQQGQHLGTNFDTQIALFELTNCSDFDSFHLLGSNDDDPNCTDFRSRLILGGLTPGQRYFIAVDGYNEEQGYFAIAVAETTDSDNDGVPDLVDVCPGEDDRLDSDLDSFADCVDLCPDVANTGMHFDGLGDYITLPNESQFDFTGGFTVEAWIKVDDFTKPWQAIIAKGDIQWRLHRFDQSNTVSFGTTGLSNLDLQSTTNVNDGNWHHIAGVFDGNNKYLYVDGILEASAPITTGALYTSDHPVMIGENAQHIGRSFEGSIDEVRIWRVSRSGNQIRYYMNRELRGDEAGLEAYFPMPEGRPNADNTAQTKVFDFSPNNHDGILNGFTSSGSTSNWVAGIIPLLGADVDNDGQGRLCDPDENPALCSTVRHQIVNGPLASSTIQAIDSITADATINTNATVIFEAGKGIRLTTNFHAQAGTNFSARIVPNNCAPEIMQELIQDDETVVPEVNIHHRSFIQTGDRTLKMRLFPNPSRLETTLEYWVPEPSSVQILFQDITGKRARALQNPTWKEPGLHQLSIPTHSLTPGLYFVTVRTDHNLRATSKLVVVN